MEESLGHATAGDDEKNDEKEELVVEQSPSERKAATARAARMSDSILFGRPAVFLSGFLLGSLMGALGCYELGAYLGAGPSPEAPLQREEKYTPEVCGLLSQQSAWRLGHLSRGHVHHVLRHKFTDRDFHALRKVLVDVLRMNRHVPAVDFLGGLNPVRGQLDMLAQHLAEQGHEVHVFEPVPQIVGQASNKLSPKLKANVVFHTVALGNASGTANGKYKGKPWETRMQTIGEVLKGKQVFSGSLGINGYEAVTIYNMGDVKPWVLFFEVNSNVGHEHATITELLQHLDERGYVLMDFTASGQRLAEGPKEAKPDPSPVLGIPDVFIPQNLCLQRSTKMSDWYGLFVEDTPKPDIYKWLQTDVVAIRRDVLDQNVLNVLASLVCNERHHLGKLLTAQDYKEGKLGSVRRCVDPTGLMRQAGFAKEGDVVLDVGR